MNRNPKVASMGATALLVLLLGIACGASEAAAADEERSSIGAKGPDYAAGALTIIDLAVSGDFETLHAYFSEEFIDKVTPKDLRQGWHQVLDMAGAWKSAGKPALRTDGKYHYVEVPGHFEFKEMTILTTWTEQGALAGFFIKPAKASESAPASKPAAPAAKPAAPAKDAPPAK